MALKNLLVRCGADFSDLYAAMKKASTSAKAMERSVQQSSGRMSSALQKSSGRMNSAFLRIGKIAAAAFSAYKLVEFGKESISMASDIAEVQNVVDTAFGGMSAQVDAWAKTTVDKFGMSELSAKQTASTYMSMAKSMGLTETAASDMSISLAELTGDVASFYNISQDAAGTKLKSVFTGETETLKDLGVVMTQTNLDAFALASGFGKTTSKMSQAEKVQLRYLYVTQQLSMAQGDFSKTSGSWANQTRVLSERWKEFMSVIGTGLIQVLTPVVKFLNDCLAKMISIANQVSQVMSSAFGWDTGKQESSAAAIESMADAQTDLADATKAASKEAKKAQVSFDELNVLSKNDNDSVAGSSALGGSIGTAGVSSSGGNKSATSSIQLPKIDAFDKFVAGVQKGVKSIDFGAIQKNCERAFSAIQPIAKTAFNGAKKVTKSFLGTVGSTAGGAVSVTGKAIQTVSGGVATWLEKDNKKISDGIAEMAQNTSSGFDNVSSTVERVTSVMGDSIDRNRPKTETAIAKLLSGFTAFGLAVGTITTDAFNVATGVIDDWTDNNKKTLSTFFDNISNKFRGLGTLVGQVSGDIGQSLSDFWDNRGSEVFRNFMTAVTDIGAKFLEIYNEWISPVVDKLIAGCTKLWNTHLKPLWDNIVHFISSVVDYLSTLWNKWLSPYISWLVKTLKPVIMAVVNTIWSSIQTTIGKITDVLSGIIRALSGLLDFIVGVFTGNWKKAWNGIKDFFGGIWDAIWGIVKGTINHIVDGINFLWNGVYAVVSGIVNAVGGIAGALGDLFGKNWRFEMPADPPLIPKLASGGIAYSATVAMIGEGRYDEAVLPLSDSTYQRIADGINNSRTDDGEQVALLREQNSLLRKLLDKDPMVRAVVSTSDIVSGIDRKNRRDGKTAVPVGV